MNRLHAVALLFGALVIASADAAIIVDTGPGPPVGFGLIVSGPDNDPFGIGFQSLGAEFVLTNAEDITSIQGWMSGSSLTFLGTGATIAVRADAAGVPAVAELFSATFAGPTSKSVPDWFGVSGVDWHLAPGTYWTTFEVRPGQTVVATMSYPVPSPLPLYAFRNGVGYPSWTDGSPDGEQFGVRIFGVPEPPSAILLGIGLACLGLAYKRARGRQSAAV